MDELHVAVGARLYRASDDLKLWDRGRPLWTCPAEGASQGLATAAVMLWGW